MMVQFGSAPVRAAVRWASSPPARAANPAEGEAPSGQPAGFRRYFEEVA